MKFLVSLFAFVAIASASPVVQQWTLAELSDALQNPSTNPALVPYLEHAMNEMMMDLISGNEMASIAVPVPAAILEQPSAVAVPIVEGEAPVVQQWTLAELSEALQNPSTNPALIPYLEHAMNEMMMDLFSGHEMESIAVPVPAAILEQPSAVAVPIVEGEAPVVQQWTLAELSEAIQNPSTNPALIPYLEHAMNEMMMDLISGNEMESIAVPVPAAILEQPSAAAVPIVEGEAPVVQHWTLAELSEALQNPSTNPALIPYLEHAMNEMMMDLMSGNEMASIAVPVPAAIIEQPSAVAVNPAPAIVPAVVAEATPAGSPLVQIILNINQKQQEISSPAIATPAVIATPASPEAVSVVEQTPETVSVVEAAAEPVIVVESAPESVAIVEAALESVTVVEAAPESVIVAEVVHEPVSVVEAAPESVIVAETVLEPVVVIEAAPETVQVAE